jgi:hypothetical protein
MTSRVLSATVSERNDYESQRRYTAHLAFSLISIQNLRRILCNEVIFRNYTELAPHLGISYNGYSKAEP